nr:SIR2 family protein [Pyrinomonadaceae bacterium]
MSTVDLEVAVNEIQQACEGVQGGRLPYFFLVGAGISKPPISLASEIEAECKKTAQKRNRIDDPPGKHPMDTYSHWFKKAYPSRVLGQKYLQGLMRDKNISQANFRLAHLVLEKKIANLVVTTNFDDFLSRALILFGKHAIVCDHPMMAERIDPEEQNEIQIVHVHGTYWFYDYVNLREDITNRAQPSAQTTSTMVALLDNILSRRVPLVIGYSGWEGDVVMTALKRRLSGRNLPHPLYWFCYRQAEIESLPDWLKFHPDVNFVIHQQKSKSQSDTERVEGESSIQSRMTLPPQAEAKGISDKGSEEPVLPAQQVLDKLIQAFALKAPNLTSDPLQFFADQLRRSLPQDDAGQSEGDIYFIKSVVERIERAKQREQEETQTIQLIESQLEKVRDALRRSQYREAIEQGRTIRTDNMTATQLRELMNAMWSAASLLNDNSIEELNGYDMVITIDGIMVERKIEEPSLREMVAKALVSKGYRLGVLNRNEEAVAAYDEVVKRFGEATEAGLREQVAWALNGIGFQMICEAKQSWANDDEQLARSILFKAQEKITSALERAPENPVLLGNQGYIAFLLGDKARAHELLT